MHDQEDAASLLEAALGYASRGLCVFPCNPANKAPLCQHGCKDATADREAIIAWWRRWPKAMIGCATGADVGMVVDIDAGADDATGELFDAAVIRADLEAELGEQLPDTLTVRTPRGGMHLHFVLPAGVRCGNRTNVIPRVDIRGDGGYVILPPSERADGASYRYENDIEAPRALAPEALVDLTLHRGRWKRDAARRDDRAAHSPPQIRQTPSSGYASSALIREITRVAAAGKGTRNATLNEAAFNLGQLVASGLLDRSDVADSLEHAAEACGLKQTDGTASVRKTIKSGLTAGQKLPRQIASSGGHPAIPSNGWHRRDCQRSSAEDQLDRELALIDRTDRGNAERFKRRNQDKFLYSKSTGWLAWDGKRWTSEAAEEALLRAVHDTVDALKCEAEAIKDAD